VPENAWIIPSDWNEEADGWRGVCIQWPDSEQWLLLLRSLMFTLTRGRSWDRATGNIKDTQLIGWRIFDDAGLLNACGGVSPPIPPLPPPMPPIGFPVDGFGSSDSEDSEDEEMPVSCAFSTAAPAVSRT